MVADSDKEDEVKLEFDSAGQAIAYISLDQARVLALQHARDNREFYGRYAGQELVWAEPGAETTVPGVLSVPAETAFLPLFDQRQLFLPSNDDYSCLFSSSP